MNENYLNRSFSIDFMRFIGLTFIVLAHIGAPYNIVQLRCFDVPLMVFVSALCFKSNGENLGKYCFKRVKRLYIPTFVFLCLYFSLIYVVSKFGIRIPYTHEQVLGTYLLLEKPSIGYVWIIRVFILMSLIAPIAKRAIDNLNPIVTLLMLGVALFAVEILLKIDVVSSQLGRFLINEFVIYTLSYGIILCLGFWLKRVNALTGKFFAWLGVVTFIVILIIMCYQRSVLPISSGYKYPPHGLYVIYGISVVLILYLLPLENLSKYKISHIITWISSHSLWIYLWHIPFVVFLNFLSQMDRHWVIKWEIAYSGAILLTYYQVLLVQRILSFRPNWKWIKYLQN